MSCHLFADEVVDAIEDEDIIIEKTIHLSPAEDLELKNGDRTTLEIESKFSDEDLQSYLRKKIANTFYVLDFFKNDQGRFYKVFVLNPIKEVSKEKDKKPIFTLSEDFKIEFDKNRITKDFLMLDTPYIEVKKTPVWKIVIFILLSLFVLICLYQFIVRPQMEKNKLKKSRKMKAEKIIKQLDHVETREDFENIYKIKAQLDELLEFDSSALKKFYKHLDTIQYKAEWTESDKESLEQIYRKIGDVKFKDGI